MDENPGIISKIHKLLTLANRSDNDGESQNAMLLAQKLMAQNGIEQSAVERFDQQPKKGVTEGIIETQKRTIWWKKILAVIVADNFRCKLLMYRQQRFDFERKRLVIDCKIVFLGLTADVAIAQRVYSFAKKEAKYFADRYMRGLKTTPKILLPSGLRNDFLSGFLSGLEEKFEKQVAENNWQMIILPDDAVMERFNAIAPKTAKASAKIASAGSMNALRAGHKDGLNCNLEHDNVAG